MFLINLLHFLFRNNLNKHFKDICEMKKSDLLKTNDYESRYLSQDSKDEIISNCHSSYSFIKTGEKETPVPTLERKKNPLQNKKSDFFTFCNQSQTTANYEDVNLTSN